MSNELGRVADAIESARLPSGGTILASRVQIEVLARAAIAAMTLTPQVVETVDELEASPDDAVFIANDGQHYRRSPMWERHGRPLWESFGMDTSDSMLSAAQVPLPATVLHPHPTPDECLCYGADGVTDQKCPACVRADVLAEVRAFATQSAISARGSGTSEAERRWLDLLIILDRAEGK